MNYTFPKYIEMVTAVVGRKTYVLRAVQQVKAYPRKERMETENDKDFNSVLEAEQHERTVAELFEKINEVLTSSIFYLTGDEKVDDALKSSSTSIAENQRIVK